ncbi:MAG: pantetheine-phosphate adenylyltransferase [Buchnera aphidicola (Nurudea yanoniella)]
MKKIAIYPGTFDPITYGHLNIITRAMKIFNIIIIAIFNNSDKKTLFNIQERKKLVEITTKHFKSVEKVINFNNLLVNIAKKENANYVIRGIRSSLDCEYEINMFRANKVLYPKLEHMLFFSSLEYSCISSTLVKEISKYNGDVKKYVPKSVYHALLKKYKNIKNY